MKLIHSNVGGFQSQNDYQREYLDIQDEYIYRQLMNEGPPANGVASCGHSPASWRCLTCHAQPTFCTSCCRDTHGAHPLHRVGFWQGQHFRPAWLRQVGIQIHCGHSGSPCPVLGRYADCSDAGDVEEDAGISSLNPDYPAPAPIRVSEPSLHFTDNVDDDDDEIPYMVEEPDSDLEDEDADLCDNRDIDRLAPAIADLPWFGESPRQPPPSQPASHGFRNDRMVVVVDIEGIHELPFTFCVCPNAPTDDIQLLDLGYYPASSTRPKTVFTKRLLDNFLLANQECKTSPRNYYNKLRRTTNPSLPHMVPVRIMSSSLKSRPFP